MFNGRARANSTLPAIEILQRNVRKTPTFYSRKPRDIPFHLPHKKLLEKIEFVKAEPEPLTGFTAAQEERYRKERKVANLQLDPLKSDEGKDESNFMSFQLVKGTRRLLNDAIAVRFLKS